MGLVTGSATFTLLSGCRRASTPPTMNIDDSSGRARTRVMLMGPSYPVPGDLCRPTRAVWTPGPDPRHSDRAEIAALDGSLAGYRRGLCHASVLRRPPGIGLPRSSSGARRPGPPSPPVETILSLGLRR